MPTFAWTCRAGVAFQVVVAVAVDQVVLVRREALRAVAPAQRSRRVSSSSGQWTPTNSTSSGRTTVRQSSSRHGSLSTWSTTMSLPAPRPWPRSSDGSPSRSPQRGVELLGLKFPFATHRVEAVDRQAEEDAVVQDVQ